MRLEYAAETDQAYISFLDRPMRWGEAVEQVVIDRDELGGDVIFDLDPDGRILGVEFPCNARAMLPAEVFGD